ncbi:MAG: Flp family type IVb pilin [Pseudomonadota bacterium]
MNLLRAFQSDQRGAAAVQYALVAGVLSLVVLAGSLAMRGSIVDLYDTMAAQANDALQVEPAAGPEAGGNSQQS